MNSRFSRLAHIVLLLCAYIGAVWGVPATNAPIVRYMDDGRTDTVYLHGDEHLSYLTSQPGEVKELSSDATLRRSPQHQMLTSFMPSQGRIRVPVILVNFSDLSFTIDDPIAQFDDLFNGKGGSNPHATGSVHDYYMASSDSLLDLHYEVFGPYTLSRDMAYYGGNKTNSEGIATNNNIHASDLVLEAVRLASDAGVDFSPYDNNDDGTIDNVSIIVAGYNEAEGGPANTIWPHYSALYNSTSRFNGKYIRGYLMISEYRGSGGRTQAGIGTYCHEFGHALGLPDLYDTQHSENYTVGTWDIMCSGSYNNNGSTPPTYTAFERFMLGWLTPTQVETAGFQILEPIETSNQALLIAADKHNLSPLSPDPAEYFLLENRQQTGWDSCKNALVATGLLITHITFNQNRWNNNTFNNSKPLGFAIESAGMSEATESSAADVFPGSTKRTTWLPVLNSGQELSHLAVSQIRERGDKNMTFFVGEAGEQALRFAQDELTMETPYLYSPTHYDTVRGELIIRNIPEDRLLCTVSSRLFRYSPDNGENWYGNADTAVIRVTPDSTYIQPILVIHTPTRKNCNPSYAFLTVETEDGMNGTQVTLSGRSPRPVLVTTPVIDSVTHVSSNSFSIHWADQEDAEIYYYALYTKDEEASEETESDPIKLSQTGQYADTKRYLYPPDHLSIVLNNNYTPNSTDEQIGGKLSVWGSTDGTSWDSIQTIAVQRTTRNALISIDLDSTRSWQQFQFRYTHLGGNGGAIIESHTAHFAFTLHYLYEPEDYFVYPPNHTIVFRDLQPGTTYYYTMQAYEDKGCEPHYTAFSSPTAVTTRHATTNEQLVILRNAEGRYIVELPDMSDGLHTLAVYDHSGKLAARLRPPYGENQAELPVLEKGQVYFIKYFSGRMKRKDYNGKLIYY